MKAADADARAGRNIRLRRLAHDMAKADQAGRIGITLEQVRLVRALARIKDRHLRRSVVALVETLAARCAG